MSETRAYISEGNILHIAEVARLRAPRHAFWRTALLVLLAIPVLVGLLDVVSRVASAAPQNASATAQIMVDADAPDAALQSQPVGIAAPTASSTGIVPTHLSIPAIGVDASVEKLGLNAAGAMQAPSNFTDVGWYKDGALPGAPGSAVIDGHVNNALTESGVFEHLAQLSAGDTIIVSDASGATRTFTVSSVKTYPVDGAPTSDIFSKAGPAGLVLVTCDGTWEPDKNEFSNRLVVYASLAGSD